MLTFHVIPLFLVIASEAWNLKVCACAMILDSSLRSATFRMTECQHYLVLQSDSLNICGTQANGTCAAASIAVLCPVWPFLHQVGAFGRGVVRTCHSAGQGTRARRPRHGVDGYHGWNCSTRPGNDEESEFGIHRRFRETLRRYWRTRKGMYAAYSQIKSDVRKPESTEGH